MYGFTEAGRDFGEKVIQQMRGLGFIQIRDVEESMWITGNILVVIYVVDCVHGGAQGGDSCCALSDSHETRLQPGGYEGSGIENYLGLHQEILHTEGITKVVLIHQTEYRHKMVREYNDVRHKLRLGAGELKKITTPWTKTTSLTRTRVRESLPLMRLSLLDLHYTSPEADIQT